MHTPVPVTENTIGLKSIADLKGFSFLVPQYQRGYRWTKAQVKDLLEDLLHFQETAPVETFYCLQPVLVKQHGSQWEIIDGQQRLTTIYILLGHIQSTYQRSGNPLFTLEYATRPKSRIFLENMDSAQADDNIDFHFMHKAKTYMAEWFEAQDIPSLAANDLYSTLLRRTKVIWYELGKELGGEHEAFIRINSGKIPLTNAELIKALFLKRTQVGDDQDTQRFERRQLEMATEWDMIEARLQQNELWYFLNEHTNRHPTRIEFLFELLAGPNKQGFDEYATFRYFNDLLTKASTEELLHQWKEVKNLFLQLDEWYTDRNWYHQLGYLITVGVPVSTLVKEARACTKTAFKKYVRERIQREVSGTLEKWDYFQDYQKLKNVLLLFNIETLHQNAGASYRFPFQFYKVGQDGRPWTLEHIHAQNSRGLTGKHAYREWLTDVRRFVVEYKEVLPATVALSANRSAPLTSEQVLAEVDRLLLQQPIDKDDFEQVQKQVFDLLGEPELHTIENLALLTANDNSALSNGVFPQKRKRIIELEREGSFIPIATRNVFLKYYSESPPQLTYWSEDDRQDYVKTIRTTLKSYLTPISTPTNAN